MRIIKHCRTSRLPRKKLQQTLDSVLDEFKPPSRNFNLIFVDSDYIEQLNLQFFSTSGITDVIAFPYDNQTESLGEICICIKALRSNCEIYEVPLDEEIIRVSVHGLLHLLGYEDKTKAGKENMEIIGERFVMGGMEN